RIGAFVGTDDGAHVSAVAGEVMSRIRSWPGGLSGETFANSLRTRSERGALVASAELVAPLVLVTASPHSLRLSLRPCSPSVRPVRAPGPRCAFVRSPAGREPRARRDLVSPGRTRS